MSDPVNAPAAPPAPPRWPGNDFPAWMNPMLVKELRQGVQSGVFAWTFVLLQGAMFVLMTMWLVSDATRPGYPGDEGRFYHGLFWTLFGGAAVLAIPMRAAGSMAMERQGLSLDLLRLTRLSATDIVFGKWLATMAQIGLLAVSILPYVVLQYFFGGLDVVGNLATLALVVLVAAVTTAVSIALGRLPPIVRGVLMLACGYVTLGPVFFGGVFSGMAGPGAIPWWTFGLAIIVASLLTAVLLEYSAAAIAPAAENHAGRIRFLVVVAVALALVAGRFIAQDTSRMLAVLASAMTLAVVAVEFTTNASPVLAVYAPFARFGLPGRLAAALFTPGWATALPFLFVATLPWLVARAPSGEPLLGTAGMINLVVALAAMVLPVPLMALFPAGRRRWTALLLVHATSFALFAIANAWRRTAQWESELVASFLPLPAFMLRTGIYGGGGNFDVLPSLLLTAACMAPLVPLWLHEMRALSDRLRASVPARRGPLSPRGMA